VGCLKTYGEINPADLLLLIAMLLGFAQILIFLSFPTQDSERLPAVASQQIAFAFGKREKLCLSDQEKHQRNFKKIPPNKR